MVRPLDFGPRGLAKQARDLASEISPVFALSVTTSRSTEGVDKTIATYGGKSRRTAVAFTVDRVKGNETTYRILVPTSQSTESEPEPVGVGAEIIVGGGLRRLIGLPKVTVNALYTSPSAKADLDVEHLERRPINNMRSVAVVNMALASLTLFMGSQHEFKVA